MELLKSAHVRCPYCGEALDIEVDCSVDSQSYIEDCQVCCRPINVDVVVDENMEPHTSVRHEND